MSAGCLKEHWLIHFFVGSFAVDGGDHVAGFDASLRTRATRQDGHHFQPMAERIEEAPGTIEDSGLSRLFVVSK